MGFFLDLILSFRSSLPGKRSISCIGSIITFLCGMVCLVTSCLTGWVNSFLLSFGSVTDFVVAVRIVDVAVRVRGIDVTVFVSRIILIIFSFIWLLFQQSTLISIMSWFFTVVARWFGPVSICRIVADSIYLQLIRSFQTVQL